MLQINIYSTDYAIQQKSKNSTSNNDEKSTKKGKQTQKQQNNNRQAIPSFLAKRVSCFIVKPYSRIVSSVAVLMLLMWVSLLSYCNNQTEVQEKLKVGILS